MRLTGFEAGFDGLLVAHGQAGKGATAQGFVGIEGELQWLVCPFGQIARFDGLGFGHN